MPVYERIKNYQVVYYGGGKNTTNTTFRHRAVIALYREDGAAIGVIYFHRDPATMPDADEAMLTTMGVRCHYSWEHFSNVLDLLRNEKPLHFTYDRGVSSIGTWSEPVGEGETA